MFLMQLEPPSHAVCMYMQYVFITGLALGPLSPVQVCVADVT